MTTPRPYPGRSLGLYSPPPAPPSYPSDPSDPAPTLTRIASNDLSTDWLNVQRVGGLDLVGTDYTVAFQEAVSSGAKVVYVPGGDNAYRISSTVTVPPGVTVLGAGQGAAVLNYTGTGPCLSQHGTNASFNPTFQQNGGIYGLTIDGAGAAAGAFGLDTGDGWMSRCDVQIRHFNKAGSIGLNLVNRVIWSEKCNYAASIQDCTNAVVIDVQGGLPSHMYSDYLFYLYCNAGQNGIVVQGGAEPSRCTFKVRGNFHTSPAGAGGAVWTFTGANSHATQCHVQLGVECDGTDATAPQTFVLAAAGNTFTQCRGILAFLNVSGATPFAAATLNDNFNFEGIIVGDSALSNPAQPVLPASGVAFTNKSNSAQVYVSGGTVSQIRVNGNLTGLTSGPFRLKFNDTITLTYTVAPSWLWIWETQ